MSRVSTDISDQYTQIAQFLTNFIQEVSPTKQEASPLKDQSHKPSSNNNLMPQALDDDLQISRRKSSVIKNLKSSIISKIPSKEKSNFNPHKPKKEPEKARKTLFKRSASTMDMETNSQDLFSNGFQEITTKKDISTKTLKVKIFLSKT